jgi:hypothetical protein
MYTGMRFTTFPEVLRQRVNWMPNTIMARILHDKIVFVMVKTPFVNIHKV